MLLVLIEIGYFEGQAAILQNIQIHLIEELSTPSNLCMYHTDPESSSRVTHTPLDWSHSRN
jgi:hypothetical protein